LRRSFTRDVFPVAGDLKLGSVHPEHIEKMLRGVVEHGSLRISVTLFADLKQMFRWAARKRAWKTLFENPTAYSDATKRAYASDLKHFFADAGGIPASPTVLPEYLTSCAKKLSVATLERRLTAIHKAHIEISVKSPAQSSRVKLTPRVRIVVASIKPRTWGRR
jgi:hypothetical protein